MLGRNHTRLNISVSTDTSRFFFSFLFFPLLRLGSTRTVRGYLGVRQHSRDYCRCATRQVTSTCLQAIIQLVRLCCNGRLVEALVFWDGSSSDDPSRSGPHRDGVRLVLKIPKFGTYPLFWDGTPRNETSGIPRRQVGFQCCFAVLQQPGWLETCLQVSMSASQHVVILTILRESPSQSSDRRI